MSDDKYNFLESNRYPKGVREMMDDVDYLDKLSGKERRYLKQFLHEYYGGAPLDDNSILNQDMKQEARRNNNNTNRDAFSVSRKQYKLAYPSEALEHVIQDMSKDTEVDWQTMFKVVGPTEALNFIVEEMLDNLIVEGDNVKICDTNVTHSIKMYIKIKRWFYWYNKLKKVENETT